MPRYSHHLQATTLYQFSWHSWQEPEKTTLNAILGFIDDAGVRINRNRFMNKTPHLLEGLGWGRPVRRHFKDPTVILAIGVALTRFHDATDRLFTRQPGTPGGNSAGTVIERTSNCRSAILDGSTGRVKNEARTTTSSEFVVGVRTITKTSLAPIYFMVANKRHQGSRLGNNSHSIMRFRRDRSIRQFITSPTKREIAKSLRQLEQW